MLVLSDCRQDHQFRMIEPKQRVEAFLDPGRVRDDESRLVENGFPRRLQVRTILDDFKIGIAPEVDDIRTFEASGDFLANQTLDGELVQMQRIDRNAAALNILEDPVRYALEVSGEENSFGRRPVGDRLAVGAEINSDYA